MWIARTFAAVLLGLTGPVDPVYPVSGEASRSDAEEVRGVTISCQTWGYEWGTDTFADELDELRELGVNWVAIHPYAFLRRDGSLAWRELDPTNPPEWLTRPAREAHARGMSLFIKPHIGYWGSPFGWRGAIDYPDPVERARFFEDYERWIAQLARCCTDADAFAVGTELRKLTTTRDEKSWRQIIASVREATDTHLTYAANWDVYDSVPFWDALDVVGIQAYFPISKRDDPSPSDLAAGWGAVLAELELVHERTGKPIVFTELGYNRNLTAAREPWGYETEKGPHRERASSLQRRCLGAALTVVNERPDWLRGAFLWKWFPGEAPWANFLLDTPELRAEIARAWR